ncbi:MAG TPA: phospholipid carrier-dependent glycosyltransferase, partial [Aggregatilineales bacterium]|nr:phospholipid carrier-dependent glycosyltransferase [Aggregatilineales bacterium]
MRNENQRVDSPKNDYLIGSKYFHRAAVVIIMGLGAFLRWYRLDNCTLASGDEWLAIGPTFQFLDKFFRNPITAIGFELSAAFPFVDIGRMGPPFDYTRSLVLIPTMPYYAIVGLFDFPIDESWFRFPGTVWGLLGLPATYFFVYQLTQRRVPALFAMALQATALAHIVLTRFLNADAVFMFWFPIAAGFWIKFLRDNNPHTRNLAYLTSMFYTASTPEAIIGLASIFTLVVFWLWQEDRIDPMKPLDAANTLRKIFVAWSLLWLVGFYVFEILIELKYYFFDRENVLNHASYLGRFFGRSTGHLGFFPDRVANWYIYPHISLALILASILSLLLIKNKKWRAVLLFGWMWSLFWVALTLVVSNSSSNFTRILHPVLILAMVGVTAVYDRYPRFGTAFAAVLLGANVITIFTYSLFCPMPENQNVAQAVGYLVQENSEKWGGAEKIGFYFPTGSLYAYLPEGSYITPGFTGTYTFEYCDEQEADPATFENLDVIFALPPDYDTS